MRQLVKSSIARNQEKKADDTSQVDYISETSSTYLADAGRLWIARRRVVQMMEEVVTDRCPTARQIPTTINCACIIPNGRYVADFVELEEVVVPAEEDGHVIAAVEQVLAEHHTRARDVRTSLVCVPAPQNGCHNELKNDFPEGRQAAVVFLGVGTSTGRNRETYCFLRAVLTA